MTCDVHCTKNSVSNEIINIEISCFMFLLIEIFLKEKFGYNYITNLCVPSNYFTLHLFTTLKIFLQKIHLIVRIDPTSL